MDELADSTLLAGGRRVTTEELSRLVYDDLKRLADSFFRRERPGITLQPTALVHEAYIALVGQQNQTWEDRAQFLGVAATSMRRVLINAAKARGREKRGGGFERVTLSEGQVDTLERDVDLIDLDEALTRLAQVSERLVRIVELRYFAGLTVEEVARVIGVSRTIVVREWAKAKAWLAVFFEEREGGGRGG